MDKFESYAKKHLSREVLEIEKSKRHKEHHELTVYEKAIIYKYSEDGYEYVNKNLRKSKGIQSVEFGELLDECLKKISTYEGLVYRGVNLTSQELTLYQEAFKNKGKVKEYPFLSTSKSRLVAMEFKGNILFRMYSKTGRDIEKIAKY